MHGALRQRPRVDCAFCERLGGNRAGSDISLANKRVAGGGIGATRQRNDQGNQAQHCANRPQDGAALGDLSSEVSIRAS